MAPSGQPGPVWVLMAAPGGGQALAGPVLVHLFLGDTFREVPSVSESKIDIDVGDDLIFGWDWISSHDLRNFYVDGLVSLRSGPARLQLALLPAEARPTALAMSDLSHGELRRLLRQIEPALPAVVEAGPAPLRPAPASPSIRCSTGWSRPADADHAELVGTDNPAFTALKVRYADLRGCRDPGR